jgi:hypothetical protein
MGIFSDAVPSTRRGMAVCTRRNDYDGHKKKDTGNKMSEKPKHEIKPSKHLKNNAFCVAVNRDKQKVFALQEKQGMPEDTEYVIWTYDPNTGECYWGHYFGTFGEAVEYWLSEI